MHVVFLFPWIENTEFPLNASIPTYFPGLFLSFQDDNSILELDDKPTADYPYCGHLMKFVLFLFPFSASIHF